MSGRGKEIKGSLKETAGKVLDDERMEHEGQAEKEAGRTERKMSGAAHEAKGAMKEAAGKLTDKERLEAEGKAERARGRAERA